MEARWRLGLALVPVLAAPLPAGWASQGRGEVERAAVEVPSNPEKGELWKEPETGMEFLWVPGGTFEMGCGDWSGECDADEKPAHPVTVDGFWMGRYEVTKAEWRSVMGDRLPKYGRGGRYPVTNVSWEEAREFISTMRSRTGRKVRLPTEAEWEYAARSGGKAEKYAGFDGDDEIFRYANFCDSSCRCDWRMAGQDDGYAETAPVGSFSPNGLGLHDMSGNVWEWCSDWYGRDYYATRPRENPPGPPNGTARVIRGGCWFYFPKYVRTGNRHRYVPGTRYEYLGFRLVLPGT